MKKEKVVYFPNNLDLNNFVTSLLLYDKIKCSLTTFVFHILRPIPKKYHNFLLDLDFIEIWDIFINDPLEGWYDEMKYGFLTFLDYSEKEFERLAQKLREKTHKYTREHMDIQLLKDLLSKSESAEYMDLYDAIKILKTNFYSTRDRTLLTSALTFSNIHLDMGQNDIIFEINRFPDLSQDILINNFNFEKFISLREKEGAKILREVIFKEQNYNNPTELLQEYNDIILREGKYDNTKRERAFWGLSNGLSIAGIFSGQIIFTLIITAISTLAGNHRLLYKTSSDKLESFIKKDLKSFIDSISNKT